MRMQLKQPNMTLLCYCLQYTMCVSALRWQHLWGAKRVSFIPEGLVAELAGVRQTSASFLLAASGHAEVTAAIGHL